MMRGRVMEEKGLSSYILITKEINKIWGGCDEFEFDSWLEL